VNDPKKSISLIKDFLGVIVAIIAISAYWNTTQDNSALSERRLCRIEAEIGVGECAGSRKQGEKQ
jgi:hypothetical protein